MIARERVGTDRVSKRGNKTTAVASVVPYPFTNPRARPAEFFALVSCQVSHGNERTSLMTVH